MQFSKKTAPFGVFLAMLILAACQPVTQAGSGEVKLSAAEVRSTFIGKPWRGDGSGRFHFKNDGSYTYKNSEISVFGSYVVKGNGTVCATNAADSHASNRKTCFTFYRNGTEYRYFHDRSGKYWPAYVR